MSYEMSIAAIDPLASTDIDTSFQRLKGDVVDQQGFVKMFESALTDTNNTLLKMENDMQSLATGKMENLHEVMLSMEHAKLQFQLMMQIRTRVLEAYQEVMRTQV